MWPFRFVADPVCGRSGLWPFRFVAVSVCGCFGLWPFRFVAVSVCGRSGLWPFRFVAISVCGRFGCGRFGLWPLWPVTSQGRYRLLNLGVRATRHKLYDQIGLNSDYFKNNIYSHNEKYVSLFVMPRNIHTYINMLCDVLGTVWPQVDSSEKGYFGDRVNLKSILLLFLSQLWFNIHLKLVFY